jgi:flagellar biosynthetic protein FliS
MRAIQSYARTRLESAPQEDLLVMLVEAALLRVDAADAAMERSDRGAWIREIHVARAIFLELRTALDHTAAPAVTGPLDATYRWCIHQLTAAGRTGDRTLIAEIRRVTEVLRRTWTAAVQATRDPEGAALDAAEAV